MNTHSLWVLLHLPFHIALVLLVEGGNQFIVWRRAIEAIDSAADTLENAAKGFQGLLDTSEIVDRIRSPIMGLLRSYEPSDEMATWHDVHEAFSDMESIPDDFWAVYEQLSDQHPLKKRWLEDISTLVSAVFNGINNAFEISDTDDELVTTSAADTGNSFISVVKENGHAELEDDFGFRSVESDAYIATTVKFRVVVSLASLYPFQLLRRSSSVDLDTSSSSTYLSVPDSSWRCSSPSTCFRSGSGGPISTRSRRRSTSWSPWA